MGKTANYISDLDGNLHVKLTYVGGVEQAAEFFPDLRMIRNELGEKYPRVNDMIHKATILKRDRQKHRYNFIVPKDGATEIKHLLSRLGFENFVVKKNEKMNEFKIIQESLERNPDVVIAYTHKETDSFCRGGPFHPLQSVDYWVAPKNGLYTESELQEFMENLVPDLTPISTDDFHQFPYGLRFGRLYFNEEVGKVNTSTTGTIKLSEDEVEVNNCKDITEPYIRRMVVSVFPCNEYVMDFFEDKENKMSQYSASASDLEKYDSKVPEKKNQSLFGNC